MRHSPDSHDDSCSRRDFLRLATFAAAASLIPTMSCDGTNRHSSVGYQSYGQLREAAAYNTDLNEAHTGAYRVFIDGLENELRSGYYTLSGFDIKIGKIDDVYYVKYRISINPAYNNDTRHTVVDMRGTLLSGSTPQEAIDRVTVLNNDKFNKPDESGTDWIEGMLTLVQNGDPSKHIWEEDAQASFQDGDLYWYHAAKLIKGN